MDAAADRSPPARGFLKAPQSFISGVVLVALALFAIWLTSDLPQGTLRSMGPAMLPRWLAIGVGVCGLALIGIGLLAEGHQLEAVSFRGPVVVLVAIAIFGLTIRGFPLGFANVPSLGLLGAGPLMIFVSGLASSEARVRELAVLALMLTAFCMFLFGDLLNLPIPMYPQWFADLYPAGWSSDGRLRATALALVVVAFAILMTGRRRAAGEPIDVADHQVEHGQRGRI